MTISFSRTTLLACLLFFSTNSPGPAQVTGRGGQAGELLRFGVGARALAMAGAFTAQSDDPSGIYYNPAGIGQINQLQISFMQFQLSEEAQYNFLGIAYPFRLKSERFKHSIGVSLVNLDSKEFERTGPSNEVLGTFSSQDLAVLLPYSLNHVGSWASINVGVMPMFFSQSIAGESGRGFGLDLGLMVQPLSPRFLGFVPLKALMPWRVGVNIRMLSSLTLAQEKQDYPNSLNLGISNSDVFGPFVDLPFRMVVALEFEKVFSQGRTWRHNLGSEVRFRLWRTLIASARVGYRLGVSDFETDLTWGVGFGSDADWLAAAPLIKGLELDFARLDHPELGASYQLFFTVKVSDWYNNVRQASEDIDAIESIVEQAQQAQASLTGDGLTPADERMARANLDSLQSALGPYEARFIRYLTDYARDDRVRELSAVDLAYKDTVAARLSDIAAIRGDQFLVNRYDKFIGGLRELQKRKNEAFHIYTQLRFDPGQNFSEIVPRGSNVEELAALQKDFEEKIAELKKDSNYEALKDYMETLLVRQQNTKVRNIVQGLDGQINTRLFQEESNRSDRERFLAYAGKDPAACGYVINESDDFYTKLFMRYTKAVAQPDEQEIAALLNVPEVYSEVERPYPPFPLLSDMILADDLLLAKCYAQSQASGDAQIIRETYLTLLQDYAHSDIGKAIDRMLQKAKLEALPPATTESADFFSAVWDAYKTVFDNNGIINHEIFLEVPGKFKLTKN